jgi:diguanylate cyclase (GGDEF)-like protein/PAS domain S-box-containing protein
MSKISTTDDLNERAAGRVGRSSPAFLWYLLGGVFCLSLLILSIVGSSLYRSQHVHQERAKAATQNMAQLLEHDLAAAFDKIDLTLRDVKEDLESIGLDVHERKKSTANAINAVIANHYARHPELDSLRVADAHGEIRYGIGVVPELHQNLSGRDYFAQLRDHPDAGLVFSPAVIGITSHKWVVILARRLNHADGSFAGVVVAPIALEHFQKVFASLELGSHGAVSLRGQDLSLFVRQPEPKRDGKDIGSRNVSTQLRQAIETNPVSGMYVAPTALDRIERVNAYQKIGPYPFYIIVGLATDDFLAAWRNEAARALGMTALVLAIALLATWLIYRGWSRQLAIGAALAADIEARKLTEERLRASEERWKFALEGSGDGVWDWDVPTNRINFSPLLYRMLGRAEGSIGDTFADWCQYIHPDDLGRVKADIEAYNGGDATFFSTEHRALCQDGSWKWLLVRGMAVSRDPQGRPLRMVGTQKDISGRKNNELRDHLLISALEAVGNGVVITNIDARIEWANRSFEQISGYALTEALGRRPAELVKSGLQDQAFYEDMWQTILDRRTWRGELINKRKDGRFYHEELTIAPVQDSDGVTRHFVAVKQDISERKALQKALQEGHDLLAKLSQQVPGVIYQYRLYPDGRTCFPFASEEINAIYEVTPEQVREDASPVFAVIHADDLAHVAASIELSAKNLTPWSEEYRVVLPRQGLCWRLGNARPEKLEDGSILWHGFIADITQRKLVDEALRANEERLRLLTANVSDMISRHDLQGRYLFASAASVALLGFSDSELRGRSAYDFLHPDDVPTVRGSHDRVLAADQPVTVEYRLRHKDGHYVWVESTSKIFHDAHGAAVEIDVVTRDFSERKRVVDELREEATTDALTGIPNRRHFTRRLDDALSQVKRRHDLQASVLIIDIDHFKRINDSFGHLVGDGVLKHLAGLMQEGLRKLDALGRIGGEEFAILLPGAGPLEARIFAERLRQQVVDRPYAESGRSFPVTISIGIAAVTGDDRDIDAPLDRADKALYRAKENGRNRVEVG